MINYKMKPLTIELTCMGEHSETHVGVEQMVRCLTSFEYNKFQILNLSLLPDE